MMMSPRKSKFVLTAHVTFSVGWAGAVAVFIALAITSLTTRDNQVARSACLAMDVSAITVIVPFSVASLSTGIVQALGTKWGLFNYYWIIVKLLLTLAMTILLLLHLQPIQHLSALAIKPAFRAVNESPLILDLLAKSGAALVGLLVMTTLSLFKPWGRTQFGQTNAVQIEGTFQKKTAGFYLLFGFFALLFVFVILHLFAGGMIRH